MFRLNFTKTVVMFLILFLHSNSFAGVGVFNSTTPPVTTDSQSMQLVSYYDLRDRESFIQVSNISVAPVAIHVQIFQNDILGCPELNFYDTLTPNDTHIYNMDNLVGNAIPVNIDIGDDSNGFVVITQVEAPATGSQSVDFEDASLIGNFRIVDATGYEYRTNSAGYPDLDVLDGDAVSRQQVRYTVNFNQIGGNNQSDIVGIAIDDAGQDDSAVTIDPATFEVFVLNNAEVATSCDTVTFVCGGDLPSGDDDDDDFVEGDFLNQGINDIFPSTNGDNLICAGNQDTSGFLDFISSDDGDFTSDELMVGYAGLNNGNGMGSMDSWVGNQQDICQFFPDGDCPLAIEVER